MPNDDRPTAEEALAELEDWVAGRRSWTNLVMSFGNNGPETQVAIAQMDAAEVVKRSAYVQVLMAREAARLGHEPSLDVERQYEVMAEAIHAVNPQIVNGARVTAKQVVAVLRAKGYALARLAAAPPEEKPCPGCGHTRPDPHVEITPGWVWCRRDMDAASAAGDDPRSVGPCY